MKRNCSCIVICMAFKALLQLSELDMKKYPTLL
jgi:hypothetical protein